MEQPEAVRRAIEFLNRERLPYAVVGSVAAMVYGQPRMTNDLDVLIDMRVEYIPLFLKEFPGPEWYVSDLGMRDAIQHRKMFNLLHMETGHKVDFMIPKADWQVAQIERAIEGAIDKNLRGLVAHPQDIIIGKLTYYAEGHSPKHLTDIQTMLAGSPELIDRQQVASRAAELGLLPIWEAIEQSEHQIPPLPPDFKV